MKFFKKNTKESTTEGKGADSNIPAPAKPTFNSFGECEPTLESTSELNQFDFQAVSGKQSIDDEHIDSSITDGSDYMNKGQKHEFKTYLLSGKREMPWLQDKRLKSARKGNWIIYGFMFAAIGISGLINWRAWAGVKKHDYCLILDDSFKTIDENIWNRQVQIDGFGTGSFDWTTDDSKNAFTDSEGLHIVPTLTNSTSNVDNDMITDGYALNLTATADGDGSCTANQTSPTYNDVCSIRSNITTKAIIPPVRSARLTTQGKKSIRYGRIEVTAKLPKGDWLWPAIWMMPEDSVYGDWPLSGEIDLMESRGNARGYAGNGRELFMSTLHWGPSAKTNAFWRTTQGRSRKRNDWSDAFHTYGVEWSKDYIYMYVDNRLQQVYYFDFTKIKNMWTFGQFEGRLENGTALKDPWVTSGNPNAPFDQKFHLILNVAVGSRIGWFPDALGNKPWVDGQASAAADFWAASPKWLPTWAKGNDRGMTVKRVKMWQEGKCSSPK